MIDPRKILTFLISFAAIDWLALVVKTGLHDPNLPIAYINVLLSSGLAIFIYWKFKNIIW